MSSQELRTLVSEKIDVRWNEWAARHPHLAEAIDRVRLVESAVQLLRDDPQFITAMREADINEATLIRASRLLNKAETIIKQILPS